MERDIGAAQRFDKYSGVLAVALGRSRRVRSFVALGWLATVALLVATPMRLDAAIVLVTAVTCLALDAARRCGRPAHLYLDAEGSIVVDGRGGALVDGSFVAPWLAIIHWLPAGRWLPRTLLVAPDMLAPESFRELRVLLRLR